MHWCLAIIDFERKEIRYYDSMGGNNQKCLNALRTYLEEEHKGLLTDWVILYDEWINHSHYLNLNIWETQRGTYWLSTIHITPFYAHCLLRCIHGSQKKKQVFLLYPFRSHYPLSPQTRKRVRSILTVGTSSASKTFLSKWMGPTAACSPANSPNTSRGGPISILPKNTCLTSEGGWSMKSWPCNLCRWWTPRSRFASPFSVVISLFSDLWIIYFFNLYASNFFHWFEDGETN